MVKSISKKKTAQLILFACLLPFTISKFKYNYPGTCPDRGVDLEMSNDCSSDADCPSGTCFNKKCCPGIHYSETEEFLIKNKDITKSTYEQTLIECDPSRALDFKYSYAFCYKGYVTIYPMPEDRWNGMICFTSSDCSGDDSFICLNLEYERYCYPHPQTTNVTFTYGLTNKNKKGLSNYTELSMIYSALLIVLSIVCFVRYATIKFENEEVDKNLDEALKLPVEKI